MQILVPSEDAEAGIHEARRGCEAEEVHVDYGRMLDGGEPKESVLARLGYEFLEAFVLAVEVLGEVPGVEPNADFVGDVLKEIPGVEFGAPFPSRILQLDFDALADDVREEPVYLVEVRIDAVREMVSPQILEEVADVFVGLQLDMRVARGVIGHLQAAFGPIVPKHDVAHGTAAGEHGSNVPGLSGAEAADSEEEAVVENHFLPGKELGSEEGEDGDGNGEVGGNDELYRPFRHEEGGIEDEEPDDVVDHEREERGGEGGDHVPDGEKHAQAGISPETVENPGQRLEAGPDGSGGAAEECGD